MVYVGECAGSRSSRKRWIDTVKDCLKKRGLDVRETKSVWLGFVRRKFGNVARGLNTKHETPQLWVATVI